MIEHHLKSGFTSIPKLVRNLLRIVYKHANPIQTYLFFSGSSRYLDHFNIVVLTDPSKHKAPKSSLIPNQIQPKSKPILNDSQPPNPDRIQTTASPTSRPNPTQTSTKSYSFRAVRVGWFILALFFLIDLSKHKAQIPTNLVVESTQCALFCFCTLS